MTPFDIIYEKALDCLRRATPALEYVPPANEYNRLMGAYWALIEIADIASANRWQEAHGLTVREEHLPQCKPQ